MILEDFDYHSNSLIENNSSFISYRFNGFTKDSLPLILNLLKKKHKKAKHFCYAYIVKETGIVSKKYSDDGEPRGVAGKPIITQLERHELENVLVVVVRYFGGKKLGASRLLRTYVAAVSLVLK